MNQNKLYLADLAGFYQRLIQVKEDTIIEPGRLKSDSRNLKAGDVFICLKGENFDGHTFAEEAMRLGASYVIYEADRVSIELPGIQVTDTTLFLGQLGRANRHRCQAKVIGITGSNGKTSTKEICYALFGAALGGSVQKTAANLNNQFGVAYTLLELKTKSKFLICEMGTNHPGEIAYLSKLAEPDCAILVSVAASHIGNFGSVESVAREKIDITQGMSKGKLFIPAQINCLEILQENHRPEVELCQIENSYFTDIRIEAEGTHFSYQGKAYFLPLPGEHQFANLLLAFACLLEFYEEEKELHLALGALAEIKTEGRLAPNLVAGVFLYNDSYNANRASFEAAYELTSSVLKPGARLFIAMGHMAELGEFTLAEHQKLINKMLEKSSNIFFSSDDKSLREQLDGDNRLSCFKNDDQAIEQIVEELKRNLRADDIILVKGSRSAKMERVIEKLTPALKARK